MLLSVNLQLAWVDGRLEHLAQSDETVERLCTAPSVGPVTAAAFSSTIDDVHRFKNAHQVEAYLGLTPSELSSGEKQRKGRITKAGNARLRRLLPSRDDFCASDTAGSGRPALQRGGERQIRPRKLDGFRRIAATQLQARATRNTPNVCQPSRVRLPFSRKSWSKAASATSDARESGRA